LSYGIYGSSDSVIGRGVQGVAEASSGINTGVYGLSKSTTGRGVVGYANASSGDTTGVLGWSDSADGKGIFGYASATSGINYGVYGSSPSTNGRGVYGEGHYGVHGRSERPSGTGVLGGSYSVYGNTVGVYGICNSSTGYGVKCAGNFACSGTKNFTQPHPTDPSKEIQFTCLEGNESGTYFRGSARLENGWAVIEVPEEFRLVTEPEGLTVQITPNDLVLLCVKEKSLERIVVMGEEDVEFDYFVNGVRRGFSNHKTVRENHSFVPEFKGKPYGTQYPEDYRKILVENGTLNPDFTPNEGTASRMGWTLKDKEEDPQNRCKKTAQKRKWFKKETLEVIETIEEGKTNEKIYHNCGNGEGEETDCPFSPSIPL